MYLLLPLMTAVHYSCTIIIIIVYCIAASESYGGEPSVIPDNRNLPMVCEIFLRVIPQQNGHLGGENPILTSL